MSVNEKQTKPRSLFARLVAVLSAIGLIGGLMSTYVDTPEFLERVGLRKHEPNVIKADILKNKLKQLEKKRK